MSFGFNFPATVWTLETVGDSGNPFNPPTQVWVRTEIMCEHTNSNEQRKDDAGSEFVPRSLFYTLTKVPNGARIKFGNMPDQKPPPDAETVRAVDEGTGFEGEPVEYVVATA